MKRVIGPSTLFPALAVLILFVLNLSYTGAGYNLHRLSLAGLFLFSCLVILIVRLEFSKIRLAWGWLPAASITYIGWLLVEPLLSTYPYASSITAMSLEALPLGLVGWLMLADKNKQTMWRITFQVLLACTLVLAVWGLSDFVIRDQRSHAVFLDPNAYAATINLFLIPVAYTYLNSPQQERHSAAIGWLLVLCLLAGAQATSLSRGALLSFLAVLPVLLWVSRSSPSFRLRLPILLTVLVAAHLLVNVAPFARNQGAGLLLQPEQYAESDSLRGRILMLESAWNMIGDANPLIGSGLGTFKTYYSAYRDVDETSFGNFVHNDYVQGLQEGGIIQLGFFIVLAVFAPAWILYKQAFDQTKKKRVGSNVAGLALAILCISTHALVNFIHYVGPIALITGLYLGRAWEEVRPPRQIVFPASFRRWTKPLYLKALVILLLAAPTTVLVADGIIFKLFATEHSLHTRLSPKARVEALNLALAFRPGNPVPRILLIKSLLGAAENTGDPDDREKFLRQAERETHLLSKHAPALAITSYFSGRALMIRHGPGDLSRARTDLENAVRLVPAATRMRLALVRLYLDLGEESAAYETIQAARKWVRLEVDRSALMAFAKEAETVAVAQRDEAGAQYWAQLQARLDMLEKAEPSG